MPLKGVLFGSSRRYYTSLGEHGLGCRVLECYMGYSGYRGGTPLKAYPCCHHCCYHPCC